MRKLFISFWLGILCSMAIAPVTLAQQCQLNYRSCFPECSHLPSYPTYEKEACLTQCNNENNERQQQYNMCLEQQQAEEQPVEEPQQQPEEQPAEEPQQQLEEQPVEEPQQPRELEESTTGIKIYKAGVDIKQGDTVTTGNNELAEIHFSDGSIAQLGENSNFTYESESDIKLTLGKIYLSIKQALSGERRFRVRTTFATTAVRGTKFNMETDNTATVVQVTEGIVEVSDPSTNSTVEVNAGYKVTATDQGISSPVRIGENTPLPGRQQSSEQAGPLKFWNIAGGYTFVYDAAVWAAIIDSEWPTDTFFGPAELEQPIGAINVLPGYESLQQGIDGAKAREGIVLSNERKVKIGGHNGLRYDFKESWWEGEEAYFYRDGTIYQIGISSKEVEDLKLFDELLTSFTFEKIFNDVTSTHQYAQGIAYLKTIGFVAGYPDGSFKPDQTINRAEFTKLILADHPDLATCPVSQLPFSDVAKDAWFAPYVCVARSMGVIQGYPDGTFKPEQPVNFAEAGKIFINAILIASGNELLPSTDPWYRIFGETLAELGAIPPTIQKMDYAITRGEMSEMIMRIFEQITDLPSRNYQDLL